MSCESSIENWQEYFKLTQYYDIIGDIHGHADALEALLLKLGYVPDRGIYRHSCHKVIFLGDFIDRGQQQREVIQLGSVNTN